jgi:DNA-binding MarR family transcriptional regulator
MNPVEPAGADVLPVVAQLVRLLRQTDTSDGLSPVATAVLNRLSRTGAERLTDLARSQRASQPGMTQLVGRLQRDGLVRRVPHPEDGRGVLVEATDLGREVLGRVEAEYSAALDALLDRLDPADREAIGAGLPALTRLAAAADEPATPLGRPARLTTARRPA